MAPTHIWIFRSTDPEIQKQVQATWRDAGLTMLCEFAASGSLDDEAEKHIRKRYPEFLDPIDRDDLLQFFGRTDGRAVAS